MTALKVVPIRPGGKMPAVRNWQERAKPLEQWLADPAWSTHTRWGAPTGGVNGFWVLDVDPRHGGLESLKELMRQWGAISTHEVETPSGGHHLYFLWTPECEGITNSAGKLGPGLDIRVRGGQVLVPPTAGYEADDAGMVAAPDWLLGLLAQRKGAVNGGPSRDEQPIRAPAAHGARAIASAIEEIQAAPDGTRDETLNRNAYGIGRIVDACNLEADKVIAALVDAAIEAGYSPHKALDCASRAVHAGIANPREVAAATGTGRTVANPSVPGNDEQPLPPPAVDAQLRPLPPKPGPAPADLTSDAGRRWQEKQDVYQEWMRALRHGCDALLVVTQYDQSRVLYERHGERRVEVLGTADTQAAAVRRVGRRMGLLVARATADAFVQDYRAQCDAIVSNPSLWDTGAGLFRWSPPVVAAGPTPTWDGILQRLTDPEAFLAHVWSAFEPRFVGRQALWLQGAGNDGKTIALSAVLEGAGVPFAVANDDDLQKNSQFLFSTVWDKPVVLVGDSKAVNLMMQGNLHRLTGRDYIGVEYKHGARFNAKYQGVVWITSNQLPNIENNRSNLSRLTIIKISPGPWVDDLPGKLRAEVPGLLSRAGDAYARLCPKHFDIALNETSRRLLADATGHEEDKHAAMLHIIGLRIEGDGFVPRSEIVVRMNAHSSTRLDAGQLNSFFAWLGRQPGVTKERYGKDSTRGYRGLR